MDKVRIGIVGTGGIAQGHIKRLLANPDATITALCDIRPEALAKTKERFPQLTDVPTYDDFRKLLDAGNVDGVNLNTPHTTHHEQILGSLDAGVHVLSEKPMVCQVDHAHEVIKKRDATGKIFALNYQRHYLPEFLYVRDVIASGKYGPVQFVQGLQCQEWLKGVAGTWRHDPALSGGGQLNDSGSHLLAVLLFVTGLSVDSVAAFIDNLSVPVDINSALSLRFTNGAQGNVSVIGNAPGWYEDSTIVCADGAFYLRNGKLEEAGPDGKRFTPTADQMPAGSDPDENFVAAVLGKAEVGVPAEMGLRVIELTEAAWKSAAQGQPAKVERS